MLLLLNNHILCASWHNSTVTKFFFLVIWKKGPSLGGLSSVEVNSTSRFSYTSGKCFKDVDLQTFTSLATICLNDECNSKAFFSFCKAIRENLIPVWPVSDSDYHHSQYVFQQCLAQCFPLTPCLPLGLFLSYWHKTKCPHRSSLLEQKTLFCRAITILCSLLASHQQTLCPLLTSLVGKWRGFDHLSTHGSKLCNSLSFGIYKQVMFQPAGLLRVLLRDCCSPAICAPTAWMPVTVSLSAPALEEIQVEISWEQVLYLGMLRNRQGKQL